MIPMEGFSSGMMGAGVLFGVLFLVAGHEGDSDLVRANIYLTPSRLHLAP
jgi:hypothetical protein